MNAKAFARIVLLGMVAAALFAWAMKEFGPSNAVATSTGGKDSASVSVTRPDGVTVINFHGAKRCRTCVGIGDLARKTLAEEFAAEQRAGKVRWEHINYDEPANAHFVTDYELASSTVLVTLWKDGKEVKWNRLDGVWDHVGDERKFRDYVVRGVRGLLNP